MENNSTMTVTLEQLKDELSVLSTMTKSKSQFLTEALVEVCNNEWKVNSIESGHSVYTQLEVTEGQKYLKVWSYLVSGDGRLNGRSCWMFVDKNTGECYKPASYKAPAKGVRYLITQLVDNPHICDPYGSFLYL
tara:strand:- start:176 stop:577 length:402 start_codon:yes stop_codon:yes gene_type:complete